MKKFKIFLLIFVLIITTGCTIDISKKDDKNDFGKLENQIENEEKINSIGKESDFDKPLSIGEYGIASKYNVYLNEYKDVDVNLIEIKENSDKIVEEYNLSNPNNKIEKQDDFKFVVLEYEVIFFDFKTESFGDNVRLDINVSDSSNNSFVVDGVKQIIEIYILEEDLSVFDGGKGNVKIAFSIPKNINNYLIKFGTYDHTIAYYKV